MDRDSAGSTSRGMPITDDVVQALADEAEVGYDSAQLRRSGGRKPIGSAAARVIPVRLDPELEEAVRRRAATDDSTTSQVIRDALRVYLHSA